MRVVQSIAGVLIPSKRESRASLTRSATINKQNCAQPHPDAIKGTEQRLGPKSALLHPQPRTSSSSLPHSQLFIEQCLDAEKAARCAFVCRQSLLSFAELVVLRVSAKVVPNVIVRFFEITSRVRVSSISSSHHHLIPSQVSQNPLFVVSLVVEVSNVSRA
jgi:hypothetical protein